MSEARASSTSGGEEEADTSSETEMLFACRHCPGLKFRESEKEAHRAEHKRNRRAEGRSQTPSSSVAGASSFVLFEPLDLTKDLAPPKKKPKEKEDGNVAAEAETSKKIYRKKKSIKKFDVKYRQTRKHSG